MNETDIRKYASLMKELGLTALEVKENEASIRLECCASAPQVSYQIPESKVSEIKEAADYVSVKSPLVGVFYASPAENADPYVSVGDKVKKGQTLCIVEAMKLMNEITAEEDGVISEICVTNGQVVEYGTEIFRIKK